MARFVCGRQLFTVFLSGSFRNLEQSGRVNRDQSEGGKSFGLVNPVGCTIRKARTRYNDSLMNNSEFIVRAKKIC